jgi:hypothetical protein
MLFRMTHHHDETTCPVHDMPVAANTFAKVLDALTEPTQ